MCSLIFSDQTSFRATLSWTEEDEEEMDGTRLGGGRKEECLSVFPTNEARRGSLLTMFFFLRK